MALKGGCVVAGGCICVMYKHGAVVVLFFLLALINIAGHSNGRRRTRKGVRKHFDIIKYSPQNAENGKDRHTRSGKNVQALVSSCIAV